MTLNPVGETREQREALTRQALAEVVRERISARRLRKSNVYRWSGVSRSFLRSVLLAEKGSSMFLFLELSRGLRADPCELLRDVLERRAKLRADQVSS